MDARVEKPVEEPRSWWPVLLVLLLALSMRIWIVARSEVAARDSIGFIKYGLRYENEPFAKVLREAEQPPAYPIAVLVASWPVRAMMSGVTPSTMMLSAQIASAFFGTLLVLPMIGLGTELFNRRFGLVAAALFQALPAWVKLTSDGLSESTFLFFVATGLWLAARAFRTGSAMSFVYCGLATGCAYLARPEGAELVPAVGVVIISMWLWRKWSFRLSAIYSAALVAGFLVCFGPFVAITGRITNKPTGRFLLGDPAAEKSYFTVGQAPLSFAPPLAVWWHDQTDRHKNRLIWAGEALVLEVLWSSRILGFSLACFGWLFWIKRVVNPPGGWVLVVLAVIHSLLLLRMTSAIGYLSERHTALIVLTGTYPATLGLFMLTEVLMVQSWFPTRLNQPVLLTIAVAAALLTGMNSLKKPLHYNRAGHRKAGEWLAQNAPAESGICDPFCWAQYFAGRDFLKVLAHDPPSQFVVVETSNNQHSRLPLMPEARAKAAAGELVYYWPDRRGVENAQVKVYRWQRPLEIKPATANQPSTPTSDGG